MSQATCSMFNILAVSGVPRCVTGSLWFGFISNLPTIRAPNVSPPAGVLNSHRPKKASTKKFVPSLWPLNAAESAPPATRRCRAARVLSLRCRPGPQAETAVRSLATELPCGEEGRAGWALNGWLDGNGLERRLR